MFNQAPYPPPEQQDKARRGQSGAGTPGQQQMGGSGGSADDNPLAGLGAHPMTHFGMHHAMTQFGPTGMRAAMLHMASGGVPSFRADMHLPMRPLGAPARIPMPRMASHGPRPMAIKEPGMADGGDPGYSWDRWGNPVNQDGSTAIGGYAAGADPALIRQSMQSGQAPSAAGGVPGYSGDQSGNDPLAGLGSHNAHNTNFGPAGQPLYGPGSGEVGPKLGGLGGLDGFSWPGGSRNFDETTGQYRPGTGPGGGYGQGPDDFGDDEMRPPIGPTGSAPDGPGYAPGSMGRGPGMGWGHGMGRRGGMGGYGSYGGGYGGYQGGGAGYPGYNPYPGDFSHFGEGPGWNFFGQMGQGGGQPSAAGPQTPQGGVDYGWMQQFYGGHDNDGGWGSSGAYGGPTQGGGGGLAADGGGYRGIAKSAVKGLGDGRSDSIPAELSDGEHVIPADVVSGLGNGSSDSGHRILNAMIMAKRKKYRGHLGKLPPPKE